jgi:hypothetical protein
LKSQRTELFEVNQDFATRNMTMSGPYFTAQVQVYLRNAERLAHARVDLLLRAYEKSEIILRDLDFQELRAEAQFCKRQGRNIGQALSNRIGQSFANQALTGFRDAITGQIVTGMSSVSARMIRRLSILRDEAELASRKASASHVSTQAQSGGPVGNDGSTGPPSAPPKRFPHSKPHLYYWKFFLEFGRECYRTWRWELFASLGVSFLTYLITVSDDPLAWRNFEIAFLATALTLAAFALWHLIRTPWIVHRSANAGDEPSLHRGFGIFGVAVLVGLLAGGFFLVGYLRAVPLPPVVKILAPPPPMPLAPAQEQSQSRTRGDSPQTRPAQTSPSLLVRQSVTQPSQVPQTQLERLAVLNKDLPRGDRDRLANAFYDFAQSLGQGQNLMYKGFNEAAAINQENAGIAKDVQSHVTTLRAMEQLALQYGKDFMALRTKWNYYPQEGEFIFGDNPDNLGPNTLANAFHSYADYLENWGGALQSNRDSAQAINLLSDAKNKFPSELSDFSKWNQGRKTRLEQKESIQQSP